MTKKTKGIAVVDYIQNKKKFKFTNDGTSKFGESLEDQHHVTGQVLADGTVEIEGEMSLDERISGVVFAPPHIDAAAETTMVQHFIDNAATDYEGFMIYVTNPAATAPFNVGNKFYFCEDGVWHPSPFSSEVVNYPPHLNPTYSISVPALGTETLPFSLDLPADLFLDQDGDPLTYTATQAGGAALPAWLSFDATNTILSGTPTESDVGLVTLTITATDPANQSASTTQEIQILVKPVPFWAGGTNSFYTGGPEDWATVLPSNLLSLNPAQGGSNSWHKLTAPDEFSVDNRTVTIDFSFADWYNSSGAGTSNNNIAVGFQCNMPAADDDFMEFTIGDSGGGKSLIPRLNTQNGLVNNYSGGWWTYDPYDPPEDISNMEDFDFRIEIGRAAKHFSWNAYYIPVLVLAKRRTSHQDLIDAGLENVSFEDIRTSSEFQQLYYDLGSSYPKVNKHFFRSSYSMLISMGPYDLPDLTFSPYVKSVQRFPHDTTTPVAIFDKFDITVDESPVQDVNIPFGDFTVEAGQPITITVPSDLFTDPDGLPLVSYKTRKTSNWGVIPSWLSFDESTGVYTGTPSVDDVGSYEIAVWGNDDASESAGEISTPIMLSARSFTLTVNPPPPAEPTPENPVCPTWTDTWQFINPDGCGTLQYNGGNSSIGDDGIGTAEAATSTVDLLDWITPGDISKALVLEWSFSDDPAHTSNGSGHIGDYFHSSLMDANSTQHFTMRMRHENNASNEGDAYFWGTRAGNNNTTGNNHLDHTTFVASEWEYRNIIRASDWTEDGKLLSIRHGLAARKKNSSYTWEDLELSDWTPTNLPSAQNPEAFIDWTGPVSPGGATGVDTYELYPAFGTNHTDGGAHQAYFNDIKLFIAELDEDAAPYPGPSVDYSRGLYALIDQPFQHTLPADFFVDDNYGDSLTWEALVNDGLAFLQLPTWLSFDPATRTFSGTPAGADEDTLTISMGATDSTGLSTMREFTLYVIQPVYVSDPIEGGYDVFPLFDSGDFSKIDYDSTTGNLTIANTDTGHNVNYQWATQNIDIPSDKKLVVNFAFEPNVDGEVMPETDNYWNNGTTVAVNTGEGYSWKYFQWRRWIGADPHPQGFFRYAGSGTTPTPNAQTAGVDFLTSSFRMEVTRTAGGLFTTTMKIIPTGQYSIQGFDDLTDDSQNNIADGYFYEESTFQSDRTYNVINLSTYPGLLDSNGNLIKFKYFRYELVDV